MTKKLELVGLSGHVSGAISDLFRDYAMILFGGQH
jgi:hypothetical protein